MNLKNHKNYSLIVLLAALTALVISGCTAAANAGSTAAQSSGAADNSITVLGVGQAVGSPDEAQVNFGVETFDADVQVATSENEAIIKDLLAALQEEGIAAEDIQTRNYNLWAEQRYGDNGPEGIAGYRVSNEVNVRISDIDSIGDIMNTAIEAGANIVYGVSFSVNDKQALEEEARQAAVSNAQERAESLAALSGVTLGEVQSISEVYTQVPGPYMGYGGGAGMAVDESSISPGQQSYQVQVQVTYGME